MAKPDITLLGATYSGVSGVTLPKYGGGSATFPWVEGSETKTANGTYDVTNLAQLIVNVSGGGGGMVYETGTYTPTADIARPSISFANSHTDRPFVIAFADSGTSITSTNYGYWWIIVSFYDALGFAVPITSASSHYAVTRYCYKTSNGNSNNGSTIGALSGTTASYMSYHMTNSEFMPYLGSSSRYWKKGRSYKWIAVWKS